MDSVRSPPFPLARSVVRLCCLLAFAGLPLGAHALQVEIDAPPQIERLLAAHLDIVRAARDAAPISAEERERLLRVSEATARELLATEGYFTPQIEVHVEDGGDAGVIRYRVKPGPRTRIASVAIRYRGALAASDAAAERLRARIAHDWPAKVGEPFRQSDWTRAKTDVLLPLFAASFATARIVESRAEIDPATHSAALTVVIDSGPRFYYGPLVITGATRYPRDIAANLAPFSAGKPYRQQDLLDYQRALEASGYYAQAQVRIDPDPELAAAVPVHVELVEKPAKRVGVGVGVSTDTGARVQLEGLDQNVLGRGLRVRLATRLETRQQQASGELDWPRGERGFSDSLGLRLKRTDIAGQVTESTLLAAKRARTRGTVDTTASVQFQTETQTLGGVVTQHNQALSANYAWGKRTDAQAAFPVAGYATSLQAGGALAALFSDRSFVRLYGRHTQYVRLGDRARLVLRGEAGGVVADGRDGIPTDFLFRAGGDNSVRGYAYQSLGRRVGDAVEAVRFLATASVEADYFFTPAWGAALFVDAGDAADRIADLAPKLGYGVGARWRSPVGPLNLDVAYGEATRQVRVHFSLGVSF